MNPTKLRTVLVSMTVALLVGSCGITAPRSSEGFADLDSLGFADTDSTMSLSLGPTVLRMAAGSVDDDPATRELLLNLDGVRVKTWDVVGGQQRVAQRIDEMSLKLQRQGWEAVISVQEQNERTHILVKMNGPDIAGLIVINMDAQEAVIVNVMGNLSPQMFTKTMVALEVDVPRVDVPEMKMASSQ